MKRYGHPPIPGQKYVRRPGAYVILPLADDQVLMTFQDGQDPEIQLPGGGVDAGEHPIPALHREVLEETGWVIAAPKHLTTYKRYVFMPEYDMWAEKICSIYVARPCYQLHPPLEPDHTEIVLPVDLAVELMANPADAEILATFAGL